jgi:hypothetical protein
MSVQDIWSKEVTITPREVAPQIVVEKTDIERIEEASPLPSLSPVVSTSALSTTIFQ